MPQSIKTNYIFSLLNTLTQMLFPLLTFPYACRVVGAEGIGEVDFLSAIVRYITIFTCLGLPMYGIREVARVRSDAAMMSQTVVEILSLHTLLTLAGYVVVAALCLFVPQVRAEAPLFLLLSTTVLFTTLGAEWFYSGIEDFRYITIRGLIVRVLSLFLLFILVKGPDDLMAYGFCVIAGTLGGNIFNFLRLRRFVSLKGLHLRQLQLRRHVRPVMQIFSFNIVISLYLQLNPVLLGFLRGPLEVGYFATASKIMVMLMQLATALGTVIMPHASNLVAEGRKEEFFGLLQRSYDFTVATCFPVSIALMVAAPGIISVFCGEGFEPAIVPSCIVAPIIFIVGLTDVWGIQALYPLGHIRLIVIASGVGAAVNLILGFCLAPSLGATGTAIAYLATEAASALVLFLLGRRHLQLRFLHREQFDVLLATLLMAVAMWEFTRIANCSTLGGLVGQCAVGATFYTLTMLARKNSLILSLFSPLRRR